jgi:hypothetical protein
VRRGRAEREGKWGGLKRRRRRRRRIRTGRREERGPI